MNGRDTELLERTVATYYGNVVDWRGWGMRTKIHKVRYVERVSAGNGDRRDNRKRRDQREG